MNISDNGPMWLVATDLGGDDRPHIVYRNRLREMDAKICQQVLGRLDAVTRLGRAFPASPSIRVFYLKRQQECAVEILGGERDEAGRLSPVMLYCRYPSQRDKWSHWIATASSEAIVAISECRPKLGESLTEGDIRHTLEQLKKKSLFSARCRQVALMVLAASLTAIVIYKTLIRR